MLRSSLTPATPAGSRRRLRSRRTRALRPLAAAGIGAALAVAGLSTGGASAAPAVAAPAAAPAAVVAGPPAGSVYDFAYSARLNTLHNWMRFVLRVPMLKNADCASQVAYGWSVNMASQDRLYHQSLSNVANSCPGWRAAGENIAMGNVSADELFRAWLASPPHLANILNGNYNQIATVAVRAPDGTHWVTSDFVAG